MLITARLLGGRAHGHHFDREVRDDPDGHLSDCMYVTLTDGRPETLISPGDPGAADQLNRVRGRWDLYVLLPGLGPDAQGRRGYEIRQSLPASDPDSDLPVGGPVAEAFEMLRVRLVRFQRPPQLPAEQSGECWAQIEGLLARIDAMGVHPGT